MADRRRLLHLAAVAVALAAAACGDGGAGPGIDAAAALRHVDALVAIGPRPAGSEPARAAAAYIERELAALGATVERIPVGTVELPAIEVLGVTHRAARRASTDDPNLVARFGPGGKALLFIAHYDTVPDSPGAIDNAASVAILLELARAFADEAPAQPVLLAFTAAEEIGLVGAEALAAARGHEVAFAIALDLIGGDGQLTLNGAGELIGRAEMQWLADAADRAGVALSAPLAHRVVSRWWPQAERSDHGAFTRRGIRAVHFYNRGNDGEWIDLAYHSERDVPARIDRRALEDTARLLRALTALPLPEPRGDGFWLPLARNTSIPVWLVIALELALALSALGALLTSRDGLLRYLASDRERVKGAGLLAGLACYAAAVGAAIGLELYAAGEHPAPWLHDPLRAGGAALLVVGGVFGLCTIAVGRFVGWTGELRYRMGAALVPLVIGGAWLALDAPELAWIWLVPAAVISFAPPPIAVIAALVPLALVLHPLQVREAAWNGFHPDAVPLTAWIGVLGVPAATAGLWWGRRARGPLGTLVLAVGCGLAVIAGVALTSMAEPACTPAEFARFHLACERV